VAASRDVCRLRFLIGAAPVVYGLPLRTVAAPSLLRRPLAFGGAGEGASAASIGEGTRRGLQSTEHDGDVPSARPGAALARAAGARGGSVGPPELGFAASAPSAATAGVGPKARTKK
jgi:hypothetical protein